MAKHLLSGHGLADDVKALCRTLVAVAPVLDAVQRWQECAESEDDECRIDHVDEVIDAYERYRDEPSRAARDVGG